LKVQGIIRTIATLFGKNAVSSSNRPVKESQDGRGSSRPKDQQDSLPSRHPDNPPEQVVQVVKDQAAEFDESISLLVQAKKNLLAGSLELIGLEEVRGALGDKWALFAERVIDVAQKEIRRSLDSSDIFRKHGDASFLIHFSNLDKAAAEEKTKRTAVRIKAALIEQVPGVAQAIAIRPFVGDVDYSTIGQAGTTLSDALFARLSRMRIDAVADLQHRRKSLARDVSVLFSPIWHSQKELTLLNRCLVDLSYYSALSAQLQELGDPEEITSFSAEIDYLALTKSIEVLHRLRQTGRIAILLIPVDFATLQHQATARQYTRLLEAMPRSYRKFVVIEVRGFDEEITAKDLLHDAEGLVPLVKGLIVDLPLDDPRTAEIAANGVWAISTSLTGTGSLDRSLPEQLRRFVAACVSNGVNTLASGANSIGLAQSAYNAGFTFIEGTGIHLPVREPRQALRLRILPPSSLSPWNSPP
jgi:hypothetical protein